MQAQREPHVFVVHRPAPPLDRYIARLWCREGEPPARPGDRILPSGEPSLIINLYEDEIRNYGGVNDDEVERLPGAVLVGAYSRYTVMDLREQRAVIGASFRPGGAWPFFDPAADELHNAHVSLRDLWGPRGATLRERILAAPTPQPKLQLLAAELLERAIRPMQCDAFFQSLAEPDRDTVGRHFRPRETAMSALAMNTRATTIPCLCYRDAHAAIRWLCENFGFEKQAVYASDDGSVMHSGLTFGNGMIMIGSVHKESDYGRLIAQPEEIGGRGFTCSDPEGHIWNIGSYDPWK